MASIDDERQNLLLNGLGFLQNCSSARIASTRQSSSIDFSIENDDDNVRLTKSNCDNSTALISYLDSIIGRLDQLLINNTNNSNEQNNFTGILTSENNNFEFGGNETFPPLLDYDRRTDRFYIDNPTDMLHPSNNPSFMPIIITHTLTFLIGVIGNGVVIATWSMHGKFRSPTTVFLVSLAIADLFLLLVFVPLETLEYFMITWGGLSSICKMVAYVEAISATATVLNLVAVSLERFLVIVYPMRARSWCTMSSTRKGLIIIWSLAFVLATPVILTRHTSQITYFNSTTSLTLFYCFDAENDLAFIVAIYQLLVMFILPAIFMVVCYWIVIRKLWISTLSVNLMTQAENQSRQTSRKSKQTTTTTTTNPEDGQHQLHHHYNYSNNEKSFSTEFTNIPLTTTSTTIGDNSEIDEIRKNSWIQTFDRVWPGGKHQQNSSADLTTTATETTSGGSDGGRPGVPKRSFANVHRDLESAEKICYDSNKFLETKIPNTTTTTISSDSWRSIIIKNNNEKKISKNEEIKNSVIVDNSGNEFKIKNQTNICVNYIQIKNSNNNNDDDEDENNKKLLRINRSKKNSQSRMIDDGENEIITNQRVPPPSRNLSSNVMEITKSRFQVIKMLVLIVALFLVCWGPRLIMNVLVKLGLSTYSTAIYNIRIACNLLSFIHSALNPFVYGFMSSNFRSMVCSAFGARRRRRRRFPVYQFKSSQTASTFINNKNNNNQQNSPQIHSLQADYLRQIDIRN